MNLKWIFWPVVFLALAIVLFQVKYAARRIDRELVRVETQISKQEQSIEVLEAEWSHLNSPRYLADLAAEHLGYKPESKTRIVNVRDLPLRRRENGFVDLPKQQADGAGQTGAQPVFYPRPKPQDAKGSQSPSAGASRNTQSTQDAIGALIALTAGDE